MTFQLLEVLKGPPVNSVGPLGCTGIDINSFVQFSPDFVLFLDFDCIDLGVLGKIWISSFQNT